MSNRAKLVLFLMALIFMAAFILVYNRAEPDIRYDTGRNMTGNPPYIVVSNDG